MEYSCKCMPSFITGVFLLLIALLFADHLIWEIINGIFKIIEVNDTKESPNESRLDIKLHRKAFVLLMLMINSEEAKKIVYEKIREDKMVQGLSNIIKESKKKLDDLIKQKKQKEEELKTNRENGGGDEEYKAQQERDAAIANENAQNFEDDGDDSDSSSDSEDNKQEDDRMMNFHA